MDGLAFQGFGPWSRIERLTMEAWAGPLAGERYGARVDDRLNADWIAIQYLADFATQTTSEYRDDYIERFRLQTLQLLSRSDVWDKVEAVADALMVERTLSGAEVRRIIKNRPLPAPAKGMR
jgi:hypothetical protein